MAQHPTVEEVGAQALFRGLSSEQLAQIAAIANVETYPAGKTLFEEGDPPGDLYVILEGRITLCTRVPGQPECCLLSLRTGELLGWSAVVRRRRVATARVAQPAKLLRIPAAELHALCDANHDIGYAFMRQAFELLAERLVSTRMQLLDIFGKPET